MSYEPVPNIPDPERVAEAGRYFRYMSEFVGFTQEDADAIRASAVIIEKHLPAIIGRFYSNLLQYPPTRKFFLKADGSIDNNYLELRMYHQANFWRRSAGGVYDDDYAAFVDYVGRAHTSHGADKRLYIAERYVIGMVGFVQHAIIDGLQRELREYNPDLETRAIKAWNKLCMVILEMLARAYGGEHESESHPGLLPVDHKSVFDMSIDSYEKSIGLRRSYATKEILVASQAEVPVGERKIIQVDGVSIGVFNHKGNWFALRNSCLHRGGPVCTGKLEGDNIICPWHGYTYDLPSGELLIDRTARLEKYPVILRDDMVYLQVPELFALPEVPDSAVPDVGGGEMSEKVELQDNEFLIKELLPGQITLVHVDDQRVAVYNVDGVFYATQDECTHAEGPLSEGELKGNTVVCPWHFSCFDVTSGAATCRPAVTALKTYRVSVNGAVGRVEE